MKILTLRIYNSTPDYDAMYKVHEKYDKNSIYLIASPNITQPTYNQNTHILTIPGYESLIPGILEKTVDGIQFCLDNFDFDIIIRSNMSTVIDYNKLQNELLNIQDLYGGHVWGFNLRNYYFNFISGCCIVMNKDICKYLVSNKNNLIYQLPDDVAIGKLLSNRFPITFKTKFSQSETKLNDVYFYRFRKDESKYNHRENDIENMKKFYELLTE